MKDKRLKTCPLCDRHAEMAQPVKGVWNVSCDDGMSNTCGLVLFGHNENKLEMIQKWNRRSREIGAD